MRLLLYIQSILVACVFISCSEEQSMPLSTDSQSLLKAGQQNGTDVFLAKQQANFKSHMNGLGAGTESQGQGQALFRFSADGNELYYKVNLANVDNVTMAHIHLAPSAGSNGPPVLWLYPAGPPPQLIDGTAEGTVTSSNLVGPLAGQTLDDLRTAITEGLTYVNVHTSQFPGGEIRGDIN